MSSASLRSTRALGGVEISGGYGPDLVIIDLSVASHHPAWHPGGANHDHALLDRSLDGLERRAGHITVSHARHDQAIRAIGYRAVDEIRRHVGIDVDDVDPGKRPQSLNRELTLRRMGSIRLAEVPTDAVERYADQAALR